MAFRFSYKQAIPSQKELIHMWLSKPHVRQWLHGQGLSNTLIDLEKSFKGISLCQHWLAYDQGIPFGYLITSKIEKNEEDELSLYCKEEGDAITLDLFICEEGYLGKGLAVPMIQEFLLSEFPHVSEVIIDPEKTNTKAIHVYQKVGFALVGEFIASWHPVPHYRMHLSMKDLKERLS